MSDDKETGMNVHVELVDKDTARLKIDVVLPTSIAMAVIGTVARWHREGFNAREREEFAANRDRAFALVAAQASPPIKH